MQKLLAIGVVSAVHFLGSLLLVVIGFAGAMDRFDTGAAPTMGDQMIDGLTWTLLFPLVNGLADLLPRSIAYGDPPWQHALFAVNSLLWGSGLVAAYLWLRRTHSRRSAAEPSVAADTGPG